MENKYNNAKVAFLYCLSMIALGFLAIGVGTALFGLIDKFLPQVASGYYGGMNGGQFKFAISSIVIAGPVYFWLVSLLRKSLIKSEYSYDSGPRRWLTYLLLLISSVTILGSLVRVLYNYLDGDLSLRFFLKALVVLILAGLVFGYYFYDLKNEAKKNDVFVRIVFILSLIIVLGSFVAAIVYGESPKVARARRIDQQTLSMLDRVESAVSSFYILNKKLPKDMDELISQSESGLLLNDLTNKDNGAKIDYKIGEGNKYQLCSKFEAASNNDQPEYDYLGRRWQHQQGDECFSKTATDPSNVKEPLIIK